MFDKQEVSELLPLKLHVLHDLVQGFTGLVADGHFGKTWQFGRGLRNSFREFTLYCSTNCNIILIISKW